MKQGPDLTQRRKDAKADEVKKWGNKMRGKFEIPKFETDPKF